MILRTKAGNWTVEQRNSPMWPGETVPPPWFDGWYGGAVQPFTSRHSTRQAIGIPVVFNAIRLVSETLASLPLDVCVGDGAQKKRLTRSWRSNLLQVSPNPEQSAFDFWQDIVGSIESTGNAYIDKGIKPLGGGPLEAIWSIDPNIVKIQRDPRTGEKRFEIHGNDGVRNFGTDRILHIRGFNPKGGDYGLSPLQVMREQLHASASRTEFESRYFENNTIVGGVLQFKDMLTPGRAQNILQLWESTHGGAGNAGRPAVLSGGAEWKPYNMSMQDAQFVQAAQLTVDEVSRAFNLPLVLLNGSGTTRVDVEAESRRLVNFSLGPRMRRILMALKADPDLFGANSTLYPDFRIDEFIQPDAATRAQVAHFRIQDGVMVPDEVRAEIGLPPLPDGIGKIPQVVPVGGSPHGVTDPTQTPQTPPAEPAGN